VSLCTLPASILWGNYNMIDDLKNEFQGNLDDLLSMNNVSVRVVDDAGSYIQCENTSVKYDQVDQEDGRYVKNAMTCTLSKTKISEIKNSYKIGVGQPNGSWLMWDVQDHLETEVGFVVFCSQNVGVNY
jgi:hypothetical protein